MTGADMFDKLFPKGMKTTGKVLIAISLIALVLFSYNVLTVVLNLVGISLPPVPGGALMRIILATLITVPCFCYLRNWKFTFVSFALLFFVVWSVEALSIHTGFPFGNYYYTDEFPGPKLFDTPVLLGFYYFAFYFFIAYFVSNLLVEGTIFTQKKSWWKGALFIAFIVSMIIYGIDMLGDPTAVHTLGQWVWTNNNFVDYYGIPLSNYLAYILVMTPLVFLIKYCEIKLDAKPMGPVTPEMIKIAFAFYAVLFIMNSAIGPAGLFLIGLMTMILPCILGLNKLATYFKK